MCAAAAAGITLQVDQTVVEQLGVARKVSCASTSTTMIADAASKDEIDMRIAQVRAVSRQGRCIGTPVMQLRL